MHLNRKLWIVFSFLTALAMVVAACAPQATPAPTEAPKPAETAAPAPTETQPPETGMKACSMELSKQAIPGGFLEKAYAGEYKGTKVTMSGPFTDEDAVKFNESIKTFEDVTGIDIQYEGSKEFEAAISTRVDAGDAPDIVDFPQPGLLGNFVKQGKVIEVTSFLPEDYLKKQYNQSWLDMATLPGPDGKPVMAGVWQRFNGKSLVWYPKAEFDAAGYEIPTTWEELIALSDQIVEDGDTPWCIGIESGAATGWPATDWTEEMMLRTTSLENYDKWVSGELKFDTPEVRKAIETWSNLWQDKYVYGGRKAIVTTFFGDAPTPMFEKPPKCWLHKQGNFITSFFPPEVKAGVDFAFFYLPPVDPAYGKPFLVAGDIMAMFSDRPEVKAVMEFFTRGESLNAWMQAGGALAVHQDANLDCYGNEIERGIAELVKQATSFRFDASDLMPGQVGAGSFWKGMTDYVSGAANLDTVLKEIDASWPEGAVVAKPKPAAQPALPGGFLEKAYAGEYKGTKVTMSGPFTDEDAVKFNESVKAFEDATGIDIQYEGSKEFEAAISTRVDAGDAPDIVDFPQPGLLGNFVKQGKVAEVTSFLPEDYLKKQYNQSWLDMATLPGPDGKPIMAGVWHRFNGKSLVWYPKAEFDAAGYKIPTSWEELVALSDQIVEDGDTPWCIGIESGAATGWPATDWTEEMMLRTTSLENYDKWVSGELKFDTPEVRKAIETWAALWQDQYVYGGRKAIVTTFFGDAPTPMFEKPPKCWLHKQGNFITSFFPPDVKAGVDYDFFYLPPVDPAYGKPFLVAGDIMAMFNDRPEVRAVMEYFTRGESVKKWLELGGALSPHLDAQLDWYGDIVERGIAALVQQATAFRFDASDLMPGQVGAGSFWKGMTDFVSGAANLDTVLKEIDASWPK